MRAAWASSGDRRLERADQTIHIGLVIVDMRRNPHPAKARRDVDLLARELRHQSSRHAAGKTEAQHMRSAEALVEHLHGVRPIETIDDPSGQRAEAVHPPLA